MIFIDGYHVPCYFVSLPKTNMEEEKDND